MTPLPDLSSIRRLLMLGFGLTGAAVCEFAVRHELPIAVSEHGRLSQEQQTWLEDHDIAFEQSGHTSLFLARADTVVLSPGVPVDLPILSEARERGISVISEIDLALGFVKECPVIAVTGTNGKSSTVEVIAKILQTQGHRAWVAGNIGTPLISLVDEVSSSDILVLEISSYQLEQSRGFRPNIGLLLTLSPDHLHRHKTMTAYADAKGRMFVNQGPDDVAILPRVLASQFNGGQARRVYYDEVFQDLPAGTESLLPHERSNLRAALAACQALVPGFDISQVPMEDVCPVFRLPHRMEVLGSIDGVRIINDSKSTNAGSTVAALRSIEAPIILLLGGHSKGAGYEALIDAMAESDLREVVLFGEAADELSDLFAQHVADVPTISVVRSMEAAVDRGLSVAQTGDVLLLSPACSSFDAFTDYVDRGETFAAVIRSKPGFTSSPSRT
ncbi:UDP-N-acetylmuramoyl-L-alanine--D-glutamate ligase [Candidatus Bipolaricaulota bacterium]|nr:UDP-N-acetylmuramoyl-L-alanine--D-glutamate ligase [Candidatus Bipolaricaulota bacterium]